LSVRVRNWTKRYAGSTADTLTGISFLATRFRRQAYCSKVARTALSARARSIARDAATPSLALMQVLDAEIMPRSRAAAPYDRKSSVTNRPDRRRTSSVASASNSERRACCAWIGPAHRGPRPRRQQRAQITHPPIDFQIDLVKMPSRMRLRAALAQRRGDHWSEVVHPAPHGLVRDRNPTLGEQILDVTKLSVNRRYSHIA
jgi:hypothetical protein